MRIGIDLGGTKIEGIALDGTGRVRARRRVPTPAGDYGQILSDIRDLVLALEQEAGGGRVRVGVGIPGAVSPRTGLVKNANSTCLIGHPIDRDLAAALGRPVRVANDANCFAVSESVDGAGAGFRVVFGVILGTGCGAGLVIDGHVLTGPHAICGEWGHNPLPWPVAGELPGRPCYCGKNGCLETWLSGPGLAADYQAASGARRRAEDIAELAQAGDSEAQAALARYIDRLARGLASVINILDPDVIVLGGGLSNIAALYREVPQRLQRYVFSDGVATPLRRNRHGAASGVRGAAWLWPAES